MPAIGSNAQVGFGEESSWGQAVAITKFIPFLSESLVLEKEITATNAIRGSSARSVWREGKNTVGGDLNVEVQPVGMYTLFKHALGQGLTYGPSGTGVYVHKILPSGTLPTGLTIEVERDVSAFTYAGCGIQSLKLDCAVGEPLTATFTIIGKSETLSANPTTATTISTLNPFTFDEGSLYLDGGATATEIRSFSLTINNNLAEDKMSMGSKTRVAIPRSGFRDVTGTLSMEFDDTTTYNRFVNGTETGIKLLFTTDDTFAGTNPYTLEINMPRCVFQGTTPTVGGPDLIYHDMPFTAYAYPNGAYQEQNEIRMIAKTSDTSI